MCRLLTLLLLAFSLGACTLYERGNEARTLGQVTDDLAIQSIIKTRLLDDEQVRGLRINTEVNRGVVSLYGRVSTEAERERVLAIASGVRGVTRVRDRMVLVPE